jgi:hypothetical protein
MEETRMYDHLSQLAQQLGRFMAERCTNGLCRRFDDSILAHFPDENSRSIGLALAELEAEGLVSLSKAIGPKLPRVRTEVELFIACDPAITGHDPIEDSVELARMLSEKRELADRASDLEVASGWDRRRFNPAFALLVPLVAVGRVRKSIQNDYPTMGMILADEDVVALQRYVRTNT